MARLLAGVALQTWIVAFIVFFGAEAVLLVPSLRITVQLLYGVPLLVWTLVRVRRRPDAIDLAVLVALAAYLVVALTSRDPTGSLETLALAATYAVLFWGLRRVACSDWLRPLVASAVAIGMAFSLAFNAVLLIAEKVAFFSATGRPPQLEGLTVFPWETVNALPVLVLVALPFVAWMPRGIVRWVTLGTIAASAVVVIPISNGHAGYIGLTVAAVAFVLLSTAVRGWFIARSRQSQGLLLAAAAAAVVVVVLVGAAPFADALQTSGRTDLYRASTAMIGDRPLLGNGPSTYSWARLIASPEAARLVAVRLTHDVPLQTLLDGGILLGAAFLSVVLTWVFAAFRGPLSFAQRASIAALIGYAAAVTLDDFSFLPAVTVMLICLAAWSLPVDPAPAVRRWRFVPASVAVMVIALGLTFVVRGDVARLAAADGRAAAVSGDWTRAAASFTTAINAHGEDGGYWLALGQARAALGDDAGARDAYQRARDASPGDPRTYGALAALSADYGERVALLRRAAELSIGDPRYAYRLGLELADGGDATAAATAWGVAVTLQPDIFGVLPYGSSGIDRQAVADAAIAHIRATPRPNPDVGPDARWDVALALGTLGDDAPTAWQAVDAARRGDATGARALAGQAIDEEPHLARSYQALAAVDAFACDMPSRDDALRREAATRDAFQPPGAEVAIHREYVYREDSTGAMQPPNVPATPPTEMWPWPLIAARPECGS